MPQKDIKGRKYFVFEFAAKASTYIRHALAVVTVGNGALFAIPLQVMRPVTGGVLHISAAALAIGSERPVRSLEYWSQAWGSV